MMEPPRDSAYIAALWEQPSLFLALFGLSRYECGRTHVRLCQGRVRVTGPQESITSARAAWAEWNPNARRT